MPKTSTPVASDPPVPELAAATAPVPEVPARYEDALAELEQLVQAMESSQMPLDQLLTSYRRGAALLGSCRSRLQAVQEQVKVLEDGELQDWAHD